MKTKMIILIAAVIVIAALFVLVVAMPKSDQSGNDGVNDQNGSGGGGNGDNSQGGNGGGGNGGNGQSGSSNIGGYFTYSLSTAYSLKTDNGTEYPPADSKFVIATVKVKNVDFGIGIYPAARPSFFALKLDGSKWESDVTLTFMDSTLSVIPIMPGQTGTCKFVFIIPSGSDISQATMIYNRDGGAFKYDPTKF